MRVSLQNIASQIFTHKKLLLAGVVLVFLLAFIPFSIAHAVFWDGLLSIIEKGVSGILGAFASIFEAIFKAVAGLMMLVINYFMGLTVVPATGPGLTTPQFVIQGWNISRRLINILFILILAFIGLATILRLQTYQLQKTLPGLIIIALLVNFSGLFVGFFADIGNIIAKVFLDKVHGGWEFTGLNWNASPGAQVARIIFYIMATLIYFVVMLLFAVRVMILWTLTIVAPLAFGAYVLPATRKYWAQWLGQVIQWSIIGIPISFFMYFANLALRTAAPGAPGGLGALLPSFIAPFTALFLLFAGITLSMQLAPDGAQGVINFGKKLPKRITETRLGAKAAAWSASKTQGALSGLAPALKNLETKGPLGKVAGMALRPAGWASQGVNRLAGGKLLEYAASKRRLTLPKNFEQMSEEELVGSKEGELGGWAKTQNLSNEDLVQLAARMQDKKKYKHTTKFFKDRVNAAAEKVSSQKWLHPDIGGLLDVAPEMTTENTLLNIDPSKKDEIANVAAEIEEQEKINPTLQASNHGWRFATGKTTRDLAAARIYARELNPGDIANVLNPNSPAFAQAIPDANPETLHRFIASFDKEKVESVLSAPGGLNDMSNTREKLVELAGKNPRLVRAIFSSPVYQHIDLAARRVLREEFHNNHDELLETVEPPKAEPMPFKTNDITNEIKARQQELVQLANKKKATPTLYTAGREQRLLDEIDRLNQDLLHEQLEEQMIESMSTAKHVRDFLKKRYEEQYRNQINQQLDKEASFLQTAATKMGKPVEDITKERRKELFVRDVDAEVTQGYLPAKITATNRAVFQEVLDKKQIFTDPSQLAGALHLLLENIQGAEKRINANPTATQVEWKNLDSMKKRYNEIRQELRRAGTKIVP